MASGYEPWGTVQNQLVLESEAFARSVGRGPRVPASVLEVPKRQRILGRPTIAEIIAAVGRSFGEEDETIRRRRSGIAREAVAYLARAEGAWPIAAIGEALGVRAWSASHLAAFGERRMTEDREFRRKVNAAAAQLRNQTT